MRADKDDAPAYIRQKSFMHRPKAIPHVIGTCTFLVLIAASNALWVKNLIQVTVEEKSHPSTLRAEAGYAAVPASEDKWDRIVENQFRRDNLQVPAKAASASTTTKISKQTDFHDQNYVARGAENVVSLQSTKRSPAPEHSSQQSVRVTIVGREPSAKDTVCSSYREGSIERRNCRFSTGLNHRDKNQ